MQPNQASRRNEPAALIAEDVAIPFDLDFRFCLQLIRLAKITPTRRVNGQKGHHRNVCGDLELNVVAKAYKHINLCIRLPDVDGLAAGLRTRQESDALEHHSL